MRIIHSLGILLLSLWLILNGVVEIFTFPGIPLEKYIWFLSIGAGVLMFFQVQNNKADTSVGLLFLAFWLTISGVIPLLSMNLSEEMIMLPAIAMFAGAILLPSIRFKTMYHTGLFLLGIWLIASQGLSLIGNNLPIQMALALIAFMASLFLLIGM